MIFEALQSEIFRFKFQSLGLKILKIPEFNLYMKVPNIWAMLYGPYYDISSSHLRIISINLSYRGIIRSWRTYRTRRITSYCTIVNNHEQSWTENKNNRRRRIVSLERTETIYRIRYRHNWTRRKHSWKYILTFGRLIPNWRKIRHI